MGVDSSTQSCKVLVLDASTEQVVRSGRASHPPGTEVNPEHWWTALMAAISDAGGLQDISAISIAGQQHGMVLLDAEGNVIRNALLWNDNRSSPQVEKLIEKFGADYLARETGSVPVASFTSSKVLWVRENEPGIAAQVAAICLPHDYLSWRLSSSYPDISELFTDRSDASGTGYFNPKNDQYAEEILTYCLGHIPQLPRIVKHSEQAALVRSDLASHSIKIAAGMGDNAGAALGLNLQTGMYAASVGTSGTIFGSSTTQSADQAGIIAGFASASGDYLPLVCVLNASRVLEWGASLLGVDLHGFAELALNGESNTGGMRLTPYFEGERTPSLPDATGSLTGITLSNGSRENFARACVEGMLRGLRLGLDSLAQAGHKVESVQLIGGGSENTAVQAIAESVLGVKVIKPMFEEYVALGAARSAALLIKS